MSDEEQITVGAVSAGGEGAVRLPVVELLTGRGFVTGKSGSGKSILEGTPVYTSNGRKPIEEVNEGERVLSLNKRTYEQEFRPVLATIEHEASDLLRISLEDGTEIVGTEDHSFLTVDDMEIVPVRGEDVEEGTWMPLSRQLPSVSRETEIDLGEYAPDVNNVIVSAEGIRSAGKEGERFLSLDADAGRVVGLYLAEGSFDSKMTVQISATDEAVRSFLGSQGFAVYDRTCNRSFSPFARFLEAEFGRGAGEKRVPNWVFNTPDEFRAGLLSGYFDGDGTVNDHDVSSISKSGSLLEGVRELLRQFGISSTLNEKMVLYGEEERQFRRLRVDSFHVDRFADTVDLLVAQKSEKLARISEASDPGTGYNSKDMIPSFGPVLNRGIREAGWNERDGGARTDAASVHLLTRKQKAGRATYNRIVDEVGIEGRAAALGESDVQWKRVTSVERIDETRTVYDLDVELNDNFVAGSVFVHNSNSASVVAEKLLDGGYGLLIVDIDGEYYGLKEEYEILHVGADEECDIQVGPQHAEKIAQLALEKHVPIILDVSSFLDERKANELLTEVARHLFAKEKKLKQPFLLVVEEVHEYLPEGGGLDECGRMLIKVAKRGRKHGLGMCGISQRPADVKKDFITQCDWLVWHRLTWQNDTKVVQRILGSEYAQGVEELNDGEGYLMTDWDEGVRQVQFQRKRTFDAGATPGLDDFERPELKSVSDDLVSDLERITEDRRARQSRVKELERELKDRDLRIEELEDELAEARDLSDMAERFSRAMMAHATGRPFREDVTGYQSDLEESTRAAVPRGDVTAPPGDEAEPEDLWALVGETDDAADEAEESEEDEIPPDEHARPRPEPDGSMTGGGDDEGTTFEPAYEPWPDEEDLLAAAADSGALDAASGTAGEVSTTDSDAGGTAGAEADGGADILVPGETAESGRSGTGTAETARPESADDPDESDFEEAGPDDDIVVAGETDGDSTDEPDTDGATRRPGTDGDPDGDDGGSDIIVPGEDSASATPTDGPVAEGRTDRPTGSESIDVDPSGADANDTDSADGDDDGDAGTERRTVSAVERPVVREIRETVESFDPVTRGMLAYYRSNGPASPLDAHVAGGGDGDRTRAYGRNRKLREAGLVAHAGRGRYGYALRSRIDGAHDGRLEPSALEEAVAHVEEAFLDRKDAPWPGA